MLGIMVSRGEVLRIVFKRVVLFKNHCTWKVMLKIVF